MKYACMAVAALALTSAEAGFFPVQKPLHSRPPVAERRFASACIERKIAETKAKIADPKLAEMFEKCFANPLDTAVFMSKDADGNDDTCIIAGDLPDMWLRDSTTQALPYLPYMKEDDVLRRMIAGLLRRQFRCVCIDPYANSTLR